jgi:hypothetical protein
MYLVSNTTYLKQREEGGGDLAKCGNFIVNVNISDDSEYFFVTMDCVGVEKEIEINNQ